MDSSKIESIYLKNSREKLKNIRGVPLPMEQRKKEAVELAAWMLKESIENQSDREQRQQAQLARMMQDPLGKVFTTCMTDQCFRTKNSKRIADQMIHLLKQYGIPQYFSLFKKLQLTIFRHFGKTFSFLFIPIVIQALRREISSVIIPGEEAPLQRHIQNRRKAKVRLNINHLGEAILGENEAKSRLELYLKDLEKPSIDYVSIKISTIYSQINLIAWNKTMENLAERLRILYRAAIQNPIQLENGITRPKFVNLDMEEYRDLQITKELFKKVLSEPEFLSYSAGIVLQAYLPNSFEIQKELTEWAIKRVKSGGAPIKIRIVKGANLAMEQVEASLRVWPQAPYPSKIEVDSNFKKMVTYGCKKEHAQAVFLGIGSHNLFDIAYTMLLRSENEVEEFVNFEMLEGMAEHISRVVQKISGDLLLYCPVAKKEDFESAIAYLIRRLDENTGSENFLRHIFGLHPGTKAWDEQIEFFYTACDNIDKVFLGSRRKQNRFLLPEGRFLEWEFENESDTDFCSHENRVWIHEILDKWKNRHYDPIPLVIEGREIFHEDPKGTGFDPAFPNQTLYTYALADWNEADLALTCAEKNRSLWSSKSIRERAEVLARAAHKLREKRGEIIGSMIATGGKNVQEADPEVSEAIDFAEYYARSLIEIHSHSDIKWTAKGTVLVTPPWNFPIAIPCGGILAALAMGNTVLFKPAPEAVMCGWILVNILWDAGIPKEILQFINCPDEPVGSKLISDPRVSAVILTGATATAKLFLSLRPDLDLSAETGGKNCIIVTDLSDRDLAIKDILHSAFGHSGQKCSAASLLILTKEVYDDPHFLKQLQDATESLETGLAWDFSSKIVPLISKPSPQLIRGLTTLEPGEAWLIKPKNDSKNPNLWSPGIKLGIKENSFMHQTELFGPVLGIMRAENLTQAIEFANGTSYGLTSGLHSLDDREQRKWLAKIEAGNLYINRTITGAIVRRQPFGGCKASSFGHGGKAGGPNYLCQFGNPQQAELPDEKMAIRNSVNGLTNLIDKIHLNIEELGVYYASCANYAYWHKQFRRNDVSKLLGQDNFFEYRPYSHMGLRIQTGDKPVDIFRIMAAALSCDTHLEISYDPNFSNIAITEAWKKALPQFRFVTESEKDFLERVKNGAFKRLRVASPPKESLQQAASQSGCFICSAPVLATGRFELLHYLRELSVSVDYHRYGNLGARETEARKQIL